MKIKEIVLLAPSIVCASDTNVKKTTNINL